MTNVKNNIKRNLPQQRAVVTNIKKITAVLAMSTALSSTPVMAETLLDKVVLDFLPNWLKLDSGRNDFDFQKIEKFVTPAQDLNDLFRPMANVQFNKAYTKKVGSSTVTRGDYRLKVLDQRPQSISISGGRFYENAFVVDGQTQQSRLMPNVEELGISQNFGGARGSGRYNQSSQNQWVKPFDIEKIKIYDSNVPAKYGKFAGGVVDVKTKKPSGKQGGTVYYDFSNSSMEKMIHNDGATSPTNFPMEWSKYSTGFRVNSNQFEAKGNKIIVSAGGNYSKNKTPNPTIENVKNFTNLTGIKDAISENQDMSAKADIKMKNGDKVKLSVGTQKYAIDSHSANNQLFIKEKQGRVGQTAGALIDKQLSGDRTLKVSLNHSQNKQNRDAMGNDATHNWDSSFFTAATRNAKCGAGTSAKSSPNNACTTGGYGNSDQSEGVNKVNVSYSLPTKFGRLETGLDMQHASLQFNRKQDTHEFSQDNNLGLERTVTTKKMANDFGTWVDCKGKDEIDDGWGGKLNCQNKEVSSYKKGEEDTVFWGGTFSSVTKKGLWGSNGWSQTSGQGYKSSPWNGKLDATSITNSDKLVYRGSKVQCKTESESCQNGKYAFVKRKAYDKKKVKFSGMERGGYAQLSNKAGGFDLRYGIRYDRDTLLQNDTFAPRFSASKNLEMFGGKYQTTWGINRYYANSNATYHLLGKAIGKYKTQYRKMKCVKVSSDNCAKTEWSDEWFDHGATSNGSGYDGGSGLKTPHKDEFSMAMTTPKYDYGQFRFKLIQREGFNEFTENGSQKMTNDGSSEYRSFSVEYNQKFNDKYWGGGKNTFFANTTFSKFKSTNPHLMGTGNLTKHSQFLPRLDNVNKNFWQYRSPNWEKAAYYNGELVNVATLKQEGEKFNTPSALNFGYARQTETKYGGFTAAFTGRYVLPHTKIGPTYFGDGTNTDKKSVTIKKGQGGHQDYFAGRTGNVAVYSDVFQPATLDLDANFTLNVERAGQPTGLTVYVGVNNLLNQWNKGPRNGKKQPAIVRGRLYTLGMNYKF